MLLLWLARIAQSVEYQALGRKVLGLDLPAVLEATLGIHSSSSLTIQMCKIGTRLRLGKSEFSLRIHYAQTTERADNGASTLALKPVGRVNGSLKQRVPESPQTGDIVTAKIKKKNFIITNRRMNKFPDAHANFSVTRLSYTWTNFYYISKTELV